MKKTTPFIDKVVNVDVTDIFGKTESRKPILSSVKTQVYKRARGCCESCGLKLKKSEGDFHHWRTPNISPTAKTVQFLCPLCHRRYGHKRKVITVGNPIMGYTKKVKITRIKVRKHTRKGQTKKTTRKKKSKSKKKTTKKKSLKKKTPTKRKKRKKSTIPWDNMIPKVNYNWR